MKKIFLSVPLVAAILLLSVNGIVFAGGLQPSRDSSGNLDRNFSDPLTGLKIYTDAKASNGDDAAAVAAAKAAMQKDHCAIAAVEKYIENKNIRVRFGTTSDPHGEVQSNDAEIVVNNRESYLREPQNLSRVLYKLGLLIAGRTSEGYPLAPRLVPGILEKVGASGECLQNVREDGALLTGGIILHGEMNANGALGASRDERLTLQQWEDDQRKYPGIDQAESLRYRRDIYTEIKRFSDEERRIRQNYPPSNLSFLLENLRDPRPNNYGHTDAVQSHVTNITSRLPVSAPAAEVIPLGAVPSAPPAPPASIPASAATSAKPPVVVAYSSERHERSAVWGNREGGIVLQVANIQLNSQNAVLTANSPFPAQLAPGKNVGKTVQKVEVDTQRKVVLVETDAGTVVLNFSDGSFKKFIPKQQ